MIRLFGLQGDALMIYAYIHSFSKDGEGKYYGSLMQLAFWIGKSKPTVIKVLKKLVEIGLLDREEVPYTDKTEDRFYCRYWTSFSRMTEAEQERMLSTIGSNSKTGKEN
jgi:predicted transcriptional regulator